MCEYYYMFNTGLAQSETINTKPTQCSVALTHSPPDYLETEEQMSMV